jgi:hypothetical protein
MSILEIIAQFIHSAIFSPGNQKNRPVFSLCRLPGIAGNGKIPMTSPGSFKIRVYYPASWKKPS